jgi:hypothetical protein
MPDMIHADTAFLRRFADRLDPAPAVTARAAAADLAAGAPDCADPIPGCLLFNQTVVRIAGRLEAFCTEIEQGIQAYASAARDSAAIYTTADGHTGF